MRDCGIGIGLVLAAALCACGDDMESPADSRQAAIDVVIDELAIEQEPTVEVFATADVLAAGTMVTVEADPSGPTEVVQLARDGWLFFVDLHPGFLFEHDAVLAVVYADDLEMVSIDVGWWPLIDGVERWRTAASRDAPNERVYSEIPAAMTGDARRRIPTVLPATVPSYCMAADIQKWALTIGASDDIAIEPATANNLGLLLKTHGYNADVLRPPSLTDGKLDVFAALSNIRTKITTPADGGYCDELMVVWNGHGSKAGDLSIVDDTGKKHWTTGAELASAIEATTEMIEGMQVRVAIDSCYSGVHIPAFMAAFPVDPNATGPDDLVRDVHVITATTATELSVGDILPGDTFLEDIIDCIGDDGGVAVNNWLACTRGQASTQTPQQGSWFNNGA